MLDDLAQDLFQAFDDGALGLAQSHLVGHLEDIAQRLGAFAIKTTNSQTQFVDRLDDRVNVLVQDQPRQVQHGADSDPGADVGRTGRQITQVRTEGIIELSLEGRIGLVNRRPGLAKLEAGAQGLHTEVIFLVNHET